MNWNFATRAGSVEIRQLDNRGYDAAVGAPPANPRDFTGTLANAGGASASGDLAGSFFSDGSDPVIDTGGQFRIQTTDRTYTAVGSFAATSR